MHPFVCIACGKGFKYEHSLNFHIKSYHGPANQSSHSTSPQFPLPSIPTTVTTLCNNRSSSSTVSPSSSASNNNLHHTKKFKLNPHLSPTFGSSIQNLHHSLSSVGRIDKNCDLKDGDKNWDEDEKEERLKVDEDDEKNGIMMESNVRHSDHSSDEDDEDNRHPIRVDASHNLPGITGFVPSLVNGKKDTTDQSINDGIKIESEKAIITRLKGIHPETKQLYILYKCCLCGFAFPSLEPIIVHVATIHNSSNNNNSLSPSSSFSLSLPPSSSVGMKELKDSMDSKSGERFSCEKCGATFKWKSELSLHDQLHKAMDSTSSLAAVSQGINYNGSSSSPSGVLSPSSSSPIKLPPPNSSSSSAVHPFLASMSMSNPAYVQSLLNLGVNSDLSRFITGNNHPHFNGPNFSTSGETNKFLPTELSGNNSYLSKSNNSNSNSARGGSSMSSLLKVSNQNVLDGNSSKNGSQQGQVLNLSMSGSVAASAALAAIKNAIDSSKSSASSSSNESSPHSRKHSTHSLNGHVKQNSSSSSPEHHSRLSILNDDLTKQLMQSNPSIPMVNNVAIGEIEETAPGQFKCRYCDKTFDRIFSVHRHERVHTGYKPCICKVCGRGFSEKRNLRHHIIRFHSDGSGRELLKRARKDKTLAATTKQLAANLQPNFVSPSSPHCGKNQLNHFSRDGKNGDNFMNGNVSSSFSPNRLVLSSSSSSPGIVHNDSVVVDLRSVKRESQSGQQFLGSSSSYHSHSGDNHHRKREEEEMDHEEEEDDEGGQESTDSRHRNRHPCPRNQNGDDSFEKNGNGDNDDQDVSTRRRKRVSSGQQQQENHDRNDAGVNGIIKREERKREEGMKQEEDDSEEKSSQIVSSSRRRKSKPSKKIFVASDDEEDGERNHSNHHHDEEEEERGEERGENENENRNTRIERRKMIGNDEEEIDEENCSNLRVVENDDDDEMDAQERNSEEERRMKEEEGMEEEVLSNGMDELLSNSGDGESNGNHSDTNSLEGVPKSSSSPSLLLRGGNHGAFFSSYSPRLGIIEKPIKRNEACRPLLGPDGKYLYPCGYCSKTFCSLSDLNRHMNFHEDVRPFKCQHCDYQSRTNSQLKVHMMRHAGIKQYLCQTCNYNGVTQSDLNRHCKTRSHVLRSTNVCPLCSLGFSTRTLLEEHLVKFHERNSVVTNSSSPTTAFIPQSNSPVALSPSGNSPPVAAIPTVVA